MADLLGADAMTDLAVLKLRTEELPAASKPLTVATFTNSDLVKGRGCMLCDG
jgi:S1-C subfamily serine protease